MRKLFWKNKIALCLFFEKSCQYFPCEVFLISSLESWIHLLSYGVWVLICLFNLQAAKKALESLRTMFNQGTRKRHGSPRSVILTSRSCIFDFPLGFTIQWANLDLYIKKCFPMFSSLIENWVVQSLQYSSERKIPAMYEYEPYFVTVSIVSFDLN